MRDRRIIRAVGSTAFVETMELRRMLSVAPDATFGAAGIVHYSDGLVPPAQYDQIVSAQGAGSFTTVAEISDTSIPSENILIVRRFSTSGAPIGSPSTVTLPAAFDGNQLATITDVALDASNNVFVAGTYDNGTDTVGYVVKIDSAGSLDSSFNSGAGVIFTSALAPNSLNVQLAVNGGSIYAAYDTADLITPSTRTVNILSIDSSGAANLSYGTFGTASILLPNSGAAVNELLVNGSGLQIVGTTVSAGDKSIYVGDIDGAGLLSGSFEVSSAIGYSDLELTGVTRVGSGFVVSGKTSASDQVFVKVDASTNLDSSFDGDGVLALGGPVVLAPFDLSTRTIVADAAGNIYATGIVVDLDSADLAVIRLDPSGALDTGFDTDGIYTLNEAEADIGFGIARTASDAILVVGSQLDGTTNEQTGLLVQFAEPVVANSPPVVAAVASAGSVNTGVNTTFTSSFSDADGADTFTVAWDFGDGNTLAAAPAVQGSISASHVFTVAGTYTVTATVTDSAGHVVSNTGSVTVTVANTAPVVAAVAGPASVNTGVNATFTSSFSDADGADTFTVAWNFGDGNTLAAAPAVQGSISASHVYTVAGTYTVTVTVTDGAGNFSTNTGTIVVNTPPPPPVPYTIVAGKLTLATGSTNDTVELVKSGANLILSVNGTPYTITQSVSSASINTDGGNDFVRVSTQLTIPVTLIGGAGNDTLRSGSGDDILIGDDGNDLLIGRDGQDLMIGGNGADFLIGREDADILISGTTSLSSNLPALAAIMAEWTSSHSLLTKLLNITNTFPQSNRLNGNNFLMANVNVFGDNSVDTLSGGDGSDLYFLTICGFSDLIYDNLNNFAPSISTLVFGD